MPTTAAEFREKKGGKKFYGVFWIHSIEVYTSSGLELGARPSLLSSFNDSSFEETATLDSRFVSDSSEKIGRKSPESLSFATDFLLGEEPAKTVGNQKIKKTQDEVALRRK